MPTGQDTADPHQHLVLVGDDDARTREAIGTHLERVPGAGGAGEPRFRVVQAASADEVFRSLSPEVTACACGLALDRGGVFGELRRRRPDLAIVAFLGPGAPAPPDVEAVLQAGADQVVTSAAVADVARALDVALQLRRLSALVARSETELCVARQRLARLVGPAGVAGLQPPATKEAVLPFRQAARAYLLAAAELFAGDPRGLAERLGISYFAMRRLLKRYEVPIPGRGRRNGGRTGAKR